MLDLRNMCCGYGSLTVVNNLSVYVPEGVIFALIGANGAGKSSAIMTIAGHVTQKSGQILFEKRDISKVPAKERVYLGITVAPEGRRLFSDMTVEENLAVGCYSLPSHQFDENKVKVLELFPRLKERISQQAGALSGGEQQMLAIGRALMPKPKLLIIDELSLGLMPKVIDWCYQAIEQLKKEGVTILLVEQNTTRALDVADQVCVLESGNAVWQGTAGNARNNPKLVEAYLGLKK